LDKQKSNSMYIHSIHRMNFETIFNKNLDHYANAYALDYQVEIANIELENTSDIYLKMIDSQTIVPVDNDATYLSVKFPEKEDYGIIDKNGNVVLQPILKNRVNTYGPYYRVHNDELFVKNYSYYRIDEPLYPVEYDLVSPYVNDLFEINNTLNGQ